MVVGHAYLRINMRLRPVKYQPLGRVVVVPELPEELAAGIRQRDDVEVGVAVLLVYLLRRSDAGTQDEQSCEY